VDSRGYDAGIPRHSVTGKHQCLGATTTITGANLVSIAVTPANSSMAVGATKQFTATGTFSDSSTQDVKCVCRLDQLWKAPLTPPADCFGDHAGVVASRKLPSFAVAGIAESDRVP